MKRREFIGLIGGAAAWPLAARGQIAANPPLVVWLALGNPSTAQKYIGILTAGLQELGYTDGRNIRLTARYADFHPERLPALAEEVIGLQPAVIVGAVSDCALAVKKLTSTIPIVVGTLADGIRLGLVASYARPGGNVTGIMPYIDGLPSKQLELAREVVPSAAKVGLLGNSTDLKVGPQLEELKQAAKTASLAVVVPEIKGAEDIRSAIETMANERVDVAIVCESTLFLGERRQIAALMAAKRLPAVYGYRENVEDGGLISYGVDLRWCWHRAATYVHKILNGARPADLPVEFPPKIQMLVNLKTAKALGLTLSPTLLVSADEVIE